MPPASYSRPTMNPVMFCRNTSGTDRWSHSSMKCAPLTADSLNRIPLLATIPTGCPWMRVPALLMPARGPHDERAGLVTEAAAALVAELRRVVCDRAESPLRQRAAAGELARLAQAGVAGAHPDDWWGLPPLSDPRPLREPGEP